MTMNSCSPPGGLVAAKRLGHAKVQHGSCKAELCIPPISGPLSCRAGAGLTCSGALDPVELTGPQLQLCGVSSAGIHCALHQYITVT